MNLPRNVILLPFRAIYGGRTGSQKRGNQLIILEQTNNILTVMNLSQVLSKHLREVFFGGNWTDVSLKGSLEGISWQQAITKVHSFNTTAALVYHIDYYVVAVTLVLQGQALNASDKYSFDLPPIQSEKDWKALLGKLWSDAERFATTVEQYSEEELWNEFSEGKYGDIFRNIQGIIEHTHYHLGQIVLIKKIIQQEP